MSKTLKNFYTLAPADFKPGDVLACVITLHHVGNFEDGTPEYRMYRCPYPDPQVSVDGIPQGHGMELEEETLSRLFPIAIGARRLAEKRSP